MKKLLVAIVVLTVLTSCAGRVTGPRADNALGRYIAEVQATQADPASWPEGWAK